MRTEWRLNKFVEFIEFIEFVEFVEFSEFTALIGLIGIYWVILTQIERFIRHASPCGRG